MTMNVRTDRTHIVRRLRWLAVCLVLARWVDSPTDAQEFEAVGVRAQGMAGAFVAVADDATATYWNPAGLAGVLVFDAAVTWSADSFTSPQNRLIDRDTAAARTRAIGAAAVLPVVGFSYYQVRNTRLWPVATGTSVGGRQDQRSAPEASTLVVHDIGLTLVQSVGDAIGIGATAKIVTGSAAVLMDPTGSPESALDAVEELDGETTTRADVDVGAMVYVGRVRVGVTGKNLAEPSFDARGGGRLVLERQVRVGAAFGPEPVRGRRSYVLSVDADLMATDSPNGRDRQLAVGVERWWRSRRLALRGGVRANTVDEARPAAAGGISVAILGGLIVEGQVTAGGEQSGRGWGIGARFAY
jgi:F plasmid transfer operon, TraF, protein